MMTFSKMNLATWHGGTTNDESFMGHVPRTGER